MRRAAQDRVRAVYELHGVRPGFESSFYFGLLARPMTAAGFAAATTYVGPDMSDELACGTATVDADGTWRLTELGRKVALAVQVAVAESAERLWGERPIETMPGLGGVLRLSQLVGVLLERGLATGGPAYQSMVPVYEPSDASPAVCLTSRLGALRHHRADAHRAAWTAAGLTLADVRALTDGPVRQTVEDDTNRRDEPIYTALSTQERLELLAGLGALPA